jgi:hypothetical protein
VKGRLSAEPPGPPGPLVSWLLEHFITLTAVLGIAAYTAIYSLNLADLPIRSDGYSYFVYLPNWLLHGDVSLESVARECCGEATYPDFTGILRWPSSGRWLNPHPIGVAMLTWPFFLAAHLLTRWSNLPPDGFSLYYQHFAGLAGLVAMLGGLAILRWLLLRHFSSGITLASLVTVTWGTNLFHYGVYESTFSHAYSFALIAALIALTDLWWTTPARPAQFWGVSATLAMVTGLIVCTRHTNALFALVIPFYGVSRLTDFKANMARLWKRRTAMVVMGVAFLMTIAPQLALYRYVTGRWIVSPYSLLNAGFSFASPHVWGVLFGVQKGLFFWSPALLLALGGLVLASGWPGQLRLAAAVIFAIDAFLIASWSDWQFGASYGHRAFTDGLAFAAVFAAAGYECAARRPRWLPIVSVASTLAIALSVAQMLQYWLRIIPVANTTWAEYRALFLRFQL